MKAYHEGLKMGIICKKKEYIYEITTRPPTNQANSNHGNLVKLNQTCHGLSKNLRYSL